MSEGGHYCDESAIDGDNPWISTIDDILGKFAARVADAADKTTSLGGSIVKVGDEVLVNSIPMLRNILFDAHFINDPEHLGVHLGIPRMSEDATERLWQQSEARLEKIDPILPFAQLIAQIVIASYTRAEILTGIIDDDIDDEELAFVITRYEALSLAVVRTVLSFLVDTASLLMSRIADE
jgi:hypothetical protein